MTTKLTNAQIKAFREKVNDCFKELRKCGVKCRKNFSCCQSCGHGEISSDYDGSYVFYHLQESERLREGDDTVSLAHSIAEYKRERVMEILKRYGSDWNGEDSRTIEIPFVNFTPEQIAEREREETDRLARIARFSALEKAMDLEGGWSDVPTLLVALAKYCVAQNFYRKENEFHHFTGDELFIIQRTMRGKNPRIVSGYMFLDDDGSKEGMIRLHCDEGGNPKWSFWEEDGKMKITEA
jgi:hypothetical protein